VALRCGTQAGAVREVGSSGLLASQGGSRQARRRATDANASRKVLLLNNCVQPSMSPSIDAATARVLDAVGVQSIIAPGSGCCGAIRQHLDDQSGARGDFRRNIDAWWPFIESAEVEAILINASGCGAMVAEYAHLLRDDPAYADKAKRIVELARDVAEFVPQAIATAGIGAVAGVGAADSTGAAGGIGAPARALRVAFHPPCTLQHGLKIRGKVEALLVSLGLSSCRCATRTCAADQPGPTLCCSPSCRKPCGQAS